MARSREEIDLIVQAIAEGFDKVAGDMRQLNQAQKRADDTNKESASRWTELKSQIDLARQAYGYVADGVRVAAQAIGEGAELIAARERFDNLAQSIGTTADALLTDMKAATNGLISDADLVAGASDIINTGLASNHDQAVRLASAVGTLGLDMQQVILTFANNSKARLDSLGLSISDVDARTQAFVDSGMDANEAFDLAVLEALEAKMELLGDASETTAGKIQQVETAYKNVTDAFKQGLAEGTADEISGLALAATLADDSLADLSRTAGAQVLPSLVRMIDPAGSLQVTLLKLAKEEVVAEQAALDLAKAADEAAAADTKFFNSIEEGVPFVAGLAKENEDLADKLRQTDSHMSEYEASVNAANLASERAVAANEAHAESLALIEERTSDYFSAALPATEQTDSLSQQMFNAAEQAGASAEELAILGGALGLYTDEAIEAALRTAAINTKIDELAEAYAAGEISVSDMRSELALFIADLDTVDGKRVNIEVLTTYREQGNRPTAIGAGGQTSETGGATGAGDFQHGGWTGHGGVNEFAGIVHRGELVIPSNILSAGADAMMNFANANVPGGVGGSGTNIYIDARGASNPLAVEEAGYRGAQRALRESGIRANNMRRVR